MDWWLRRRTARWAVRIGWLTVVASVAAIVVGPLYWIGSWSMGGLVWALVVSIVGGRLLTAFQRHHPSAWAVLSAVQCLALIGALAGGVWSGAVLPSVHLLVLLHPDTLDWVSTGPVRAASATKLRPVAR